MLPCRIVCLVLLTYLFTTSSGAPFEISPNHHAKHLRFVEGPTWAATLGAIAAELWGRFLASGIWFDRGVFLFQPESPTRPCNWSCLGTLGVTSFTWLTLIGLAENLTRWSTRQAILRYQTDSTSMRETWTHSSDQVSYGFYKSQSLVLLSVATSPVVLMMVCFTRPFFWAHLTVFPILDTRPSPLLSWRRQNSQGDQSVALLPLLVASQGRSLLHRKTSEDCATQFLFRPLVFFSYF